ncbi:MAG: LysM peptidoglycan-binding domain-containing protein, partial [Coxiellaceae bacterium]|nr:LysM peptidoglycan-binding domain-containing protein [Coxiellaceae bacterium]
LGLNRIAQYAYVPFYFVDNFFPNEANPAKYITYEYVAGEKRVITDHATNKVMTMSYDRNQKLIYKLVTFNNYKVGEMSIKYDALGRMIWMSDDNAFFATPYDENGNERAIVGYIGVSRTHASAFWNTFNEADQIVIERGELKNGVIQGGIEFGYKQTEFRSTRTKGSNHYTLTYDDDGRFTEETLANDEYLESLTLLHNFYLIEVPAIDSLYHAVSLYDDTMPDVATQKRVIENHLKLIRTRESLSDELIIQLLEQSIQRPIIVFHEDRYPRLPRNSQELFQYLEPVFIFCGSKGRYETFVARGSINAGEVLKTLEQARAAKHSIIYDRASQKFAFQSKQKTAGTTEAKRQYFKNNLVSYALFGADYVYNYFNQNSDLTKMSTHYAGNNGQTTYSAPYTANGTAYHEDVKFWGGSYYGWITDSLTYGFNKFSRLMPGKLGGNRLVKGKSGSYDSVHKYQDANGNNYSLVGGIVNVSQGGDDGIPHPLPIAFEVSRDTYLVTDEQGKALIKFSFNKLVGIPANPPNYFADFHIYHYFYRPDGSLLGSYSRTLENWCKKRNDYASFSTNIDALPIVSESYPPPFASRYTVAYGDTFVTISEKTKNSASYASLIAEANGYSLSDDPAPGATIFIPQTLPTHKNTEQREFYNRIAGKMLGTFYPILDFPNLMPPEHHHSFWADLFEALVDIVVSIFFPPVNLITGLIEGILLDAFNQGFEIAIGEKKKFSLTELAFSGLEGGIGGEVAESLGKAADLGTVLLRESEAAVADELLEVALGLKKRFDLKDVLFQVASNTAGYEFSNDSALSAIEASELSDVFSATLQAMLYGQLNIEMLAAHMLSDAVAIKLHEAWQRHQQMAWRRDARYALSNTPSRQRDLLRSQQQKGYRFKTAKQASAQAGHPAGNDSGWTTTGIKTLDNTDQDSLTYPSLTAAQAPGSNPYGITPAQWDAYVRNH